MQFVQHMFFIFIDKKHDTCQLNIKIWTLNLAKNIFLKITSVMDFFTYSTLSGPLRVTAQRDLRALFAERVTYTVKPALATNCVERPTVNNDHLKMPPLTKALFESCTQRPPAQRDQRPNILPPYGLQSPYRTTTGHKK